MDPFHQKFSFESLVAYQESRKLVSSVYNLTKAFPEEERFCLTNQVRRSVISVPANIAEGSGRVSYKEKNHFLEISFGSLMETYCHLEIAFDLGYLTLEELIDIKEHCYFVSRLINSLSKSYKDNYSKEK